MRIALAGQRSFAIAVGQRLQRSGHEVVVTVAPRDDPMHSEFGAVWTGRAAGLRDGVVLDPLGIDLIVCAHNHEFISKEMVAAARDGAISYHPSLLPRHRGRDAVRWTIHMGDPIAGGTVYRITDHVDAGPILSQQWCHVDPAWTASDLWREELFPMGIDLLAQVVLRYAVGPFPFDGTEQDERFATWEPSWERPPMSKE